MPPSIRKTRTLAQVATELSRSPQERVSLADTMAAMGERGPGAVLLALTIPNVTVMPSLPLLPLLLGLPAMVLCLRTALGQETDPLPGWVGRLSLKRATAARLVRMAAWLTTWARPRLPAVAEGRGLKVAMAVGLVLTAATCLPLPGLNVLPGLGLIVLAAGLAEADGVLVLAGGGLGLTGIVAAAFAARALLTMANTLDLSGMS
jgi:hypothetical protein